MQLYAARGLASPDKGCAPSTQPRLPHRARLNAFPVAALVPQCPLCESSSRTGASHGGSAVWGHAQPLLQARRPPWWSSGSGSPRWHKNGAKGDPPAEALTRPLARGPKRCTQLPILLWIKRKSPRRACRRLSRCPGPHNGCPGWVPFFPEAPCNRGKVASEMPMTKTEQGNWGWQGQAEATRCFPRLAHLLVKLPVDKQPRAGATR